LGAVTIINGHVGQPNSSLCGLNKGQCIVLLKTNVKSIYKFKDIIYFTFIEWKKHHIRAFQDRIRSSFLTGPQKPAYITASASNSQPIHENLAQLSLAQLSSARIYQIWPINMAKENRFKLFAAFWVHKFDFGCFSDLPRGVGKRRTYMEPIPEIIFH